MNFFVINSGFLVPDSKGLPALTAWWQGSRAGCVDFTNDDAADWWTVLSRY